MYKVTMAIVTLVAIVVAGLLIGNAILSQTWWQAVAALAVVAAWAYLFFRWLDKDDGWR